MLAVHMYDVETKRLNEAVRRNKKRFEGDDFMFRLTKDEIAQVALRSQIATLNRGRGSNIKYLPYLATLPLPNTNADVIQLRKDFEELKLYIEDILHDQNDINESTRMQLDVISTALAELQSEHRQLPKRKPIGFIQPMDDDDEI